MSASNRLQIRVLFFGVLGEVLGRREDEVEIASGSNVQELCEMYAVRFPALRQYVSSLLFSRNREFVEGSELLRNGDEVAFLPPVSGGAPGHPQAVERRGANSLCRLTHERLSAAALVSELLRSSDGAVVIFEGVVRDNSDGRQTLFLEYEAYELMAVEKMADICSALLARYEINGIAMAHRLGRLEIGEVSVAIVVVSAHRKAAFEACREAIDQLKKTVPIWKKEFFVDGSKWAEGENQRLPVAAGAGMEAAKTPLYSGETR